MDIIKELQDKIIEFRDARDWAKFHNPKDVAIDLSVEASELLELFLWKKPEEASKERIKEELADVIYCSLLLAREYNFDIREIVLDKLKKNAEKYPVDKARGSRKKYNEL